MSTEEQKDIEERERLEGTEDADEEGDEELPASASSEDDARESDDDSNAPSDDDAETRDDVSDSSSLAPTTASQSAARAAAAGAAGSAGARLAAAKAAKAAKKAARKSREAAGTGVPSGADPTKESVEAFKESSFGQAAAKATDWANTNRNLAIGIFGVIVLGALGWVGFAWWGTSQAEAAGSLLEDAIEIATAEIRTEDDAAEETAPATEGDADEAPTFTTREARSQAALEAYRRVTTEHAGSEAATWARLGEARALFDLGQMDEARAAYEQALRDAGGDPVVAWRALEGIGFTYEVAEQWAQAIEKYEELRSIEDGAYQAPADYHIARMRIAMGETVPATTMLRELVTSLRATGEDEEPEFPFVLAQAEVRLRQLDPSAVSAPSSPMMVGPEGGGELPPGLEGIDPQILEQLRRQLQQGAGAGEGE